MLVAWLALARLWAARNVPKMASFQSICPIDLWFEVTYICICVSHFYSMPSVRPSSTVLYLRLIFFSSCLPPLPLGIYLFVWYCLVLNLARKTDQGKYMFIWCRMLDDFAQEMDTTDSKMDNVMKKMAKVLHMSNGGCFSLAHMLIKCG